MFRPAVLTSAVFALAAGSLTACAAISSAATTAAAPLADGAAGVLLTPGGVAWTATSETIQRSTNSGRTWHQVLPAGANCSCFGSAYFIGSRSAWIVRQQVNQPARIMFTTDGGSSWRTGQPLPGGRALAAIDPFSNLVFADAQHGWVLWAHPALSADGQHWHFAAALWATSDSGQTWQRIGGKLPEAGRSLSDPEEACGSLSSVGLSFISAETGWLTGDGCGGKTPLAWQTSDGGAHWQQVTLPAPAGGWPKGTVADTDAPVFTSAADGLLPVSTGPGRMVIYQTANGGQTWTLASAVSTGSAERPASLAAATSRRWVLPDSAGVMVTSDAGQHWRQIGSGVDVADIAPLSMLPDGTGLAQSFGRDSPATFPFVAYRTADGGKTWAPAGTMRSPLGQKTPALITGVRRTGPMTGIRFGLAGIDHTSDGGRHWTVAARTVGPIQSASFADREHGMALGPVSVLATADGGQRWMPAAEPALGPLQSVQMVTSSVGFGTDCAGPDAGQSALERTINAGQSWRPVRLPSQTDPSAPVGAQDIGPCGATGGTAACFATPRDGFYLSRPGGFATPVRFYRTFNGGRTWQAVHTPLPREVAGIAGCAGGAVWLLVSADSGTNESNGAVFRSADGGTSWHKVLAPNGPSKMATVPLPTLAGLDVLGPRVAWVVSECQNCGTATVLVTTDGGATWTRPGGSSALVPGVVQIADSSFTDARHGWLLGQVSFKSSAEVLLTTSDGGVTWQRAG